MTRSEYTESINTAQQADYSSAAGEMAKTSDLGLDSTLSKAAA